MSRSDKPQGEAFRFHGGSQDGELIWLVETVPDRLAWNMGREWYVRGMGKTFHLEASNERGSHEDQ
jgi:hypothetical protein